MILPKSQKGDAERKKFWKQLKPEPNPAINKTASQRPKSPATDPFLGLFFSSSKTDGDINHRYSWLIDNSLLCPLASPA